LSFGSKIAGRAAGRALRNPFFWAVLLVMLGLLWFMTR
jgi:hypothetical protein